MGTFRRLINAGRKLFRAPQPVPMRPVRPTEPHLVEPSTAYPGDYQGPLTMIYAPHNDDRADPGEVVWTWVPFEDDHSQGKDRPVLVIATQHFQSQDWLLALPLSSQNHQLDQEQEAHENRFWAKLGAGAWDPEGHNSFVRLNRVVRIRPDAVRRIGGRLERDRFDAIAQEVQRKR